MKIEEISKLKNISDNYYVSTSHKDKIYRYVASIYIERITSKNYRPIAVKLYNSTLVYEIYDYSVICKKLLTLPHIDDNMLAAFIETFDSEVKSYKIKDLTLEQAQEIINNNVILLNKLNNRILEDDILAKLEL